ncbi:ABC transporter permease [Virgisporangium aurantiacum]|uniref:ABC transporter permease n=2 Tax=Virgisporangium aurantiacum TaxID=175570 RepID=A0A8J3Z3B4_9ACTN|nr:ABC transporter permease [Virgisporangium aurantiacum]
MSNDARVTPAPAPRWGRRGERIAEILFVVPAALAIAVLFGYPVVKNLVMSFQDYSLRTFFTGEAPWVGLRNFATVADDAVFTKAVVNTVVFTAGSIAGQFVIGLSLAVFFHRNFPLNRLIRALFLLPWLIPLIVGSAAWRAILDQDSGILNVMLQRAGVIDSPVPWLTSPDVALVTVILVNIWLGVPFNLTLLYSGLQDIPSDLYEAGSLDGATGWKAFRHITWPNLREVVGIVLMLGVIYTLKVIDIILGLTGGGPANATETIATQSYERSFVEFAFGEGAALSNILIVISLAFAVVYLRATRRRIYD